MGDVHNVKCLPEYFQSAVDGLKPFEVHRNDRDYKVGDVLCLEEWSPHGGYTGRIYGREITYVLDDPAYCKDGFVVLGLIVEEAIQLNLLTKIFNCDPRDPAQFKALLDKLKGWGAAEQGRRMIVLPFGVGDTVYRAFRRCDETISPCGRRNCDGCHHMMVGIHEERIETEVKAVSLASCWQLTVFATRKEAAAAFERDPDNAQPRQGLVST